VKISIAIVGVCLVFCLTTPCWSEKDNDGTDWICRGQDNIYTPVDFTRPYIYTNHYYDVVAAGTAAEVGHGNDHTAICITTVRDRVYWTAGKKDSITIDKPKAITQDAACSSTAVSQNPPFQNKLPAAVKYIFPSGPALKEYAGCAYDVVYHKTNPAGDQASIQGDPHIFVRNGYLADDIDYLLLNISDLVLELSNLKQLQQHVSSQHDAGPTK
jgi:hypothetical protein